MYISYVSLNQINTDFDDKYVFYNTKLGEEAQQDIESR